MRCEYCNAEPVRACLKCGCLVCRTHSRVFGSKGYGTQVNLSSQCMKCAEATGRQLSRSGTVFFLIGAIEFVIGAIVAAASGLTVLGLILIGQGTIFAATGLFLRKRSDSQRIRND